MRHEGDIDNPDESGRGHEVRDVNFKNILLLGIGLAGLVAVLLFILVGMYRLLSAKPVEERFPPSPFATEKGAGVLPPEPRLESDPPVNLGHIMEREDSLLRSYTWFDKDSGLVRMPIDSAMKRLLTQGLPARTQTPAPESSIAPPGGGGRPGSGKERNKQ